MRKPAPSELYCLIALIRFRAADASAKLVKISQTEAIRPVDDDGVGVRDVEPAFNDGRADQDVDFPCDEAFHDGLQFVRIHLTMSDIDARVRAKVGDLVAHALNALDAVVQEENLTLAL